uniref:60S acidic ribosomal protein P0 n=1 Tax=Amorphochlora amoebiformis TaxID=1561963 RepID=A0A0H5BLE7_9EUKA|nr:60S acidic ribosomal protein P0 [Amorphochlora amoebiformis]
MGSLRSQKNLENRLNRLINQNKFLILYKMDNIKSKQLHDIKKHLKNIATIIVGKKSFIKFLILKNIAKNIKLKNLLEYIKGNICILFTNYNIYPIQLIINRYFLRSYVRIGNIATKNIIIKKGIKNLSPSQTPFFQSLGIPTRVTKGSIEIINDIILVKKNSSISASHEALLKKLDIKPLKYGLKINKAFYNLQNIDSKLVEIKNCNLDHNLSHINGILAKISIKCTLFLKYNVGFNLLNLINNYYRIYSLDK